MRPVNLLSAMSAPFRDGYAEPRSIVDWVLERAAELSAIVIGWVLITLVLVLEFRLDVSAVQAAAAVAAMVAAVIATMAVCSRYHCFTEASFKERISTAFRSMIGSGAVTMPLAWLLSPESAVGVYIGASLAGVAAGVLTYWFTPWSIKAERGSQMITREELR